MYKYDISIDDWDDSLSYVVNKVFKYNTDHIIINNVFTANVIIDLCHERDNYYQCPLHLSLYSPVCEISHSVFEHVQYSPVIRYW